MQKTLALKNIWPNGENRERERESAREREKVKERGRKCEREGGRYR